MGPTQNGKQWTTGFFNFSASTSTMEMYDLRTYGQLGLHLWSEGAQIEDNTDAFLITVESTSIGVPIAIHRVRTAAMLTAAASARLGLTYVVGERGLTALFGVGEGLGWNDQYQNQQVFVSSGPIIQRFPCALDGGCQSRVSTLGAERFVTGRLLMPMNVSVFSDKGLAEVAIYNGRQLYRRFSLGGNTSFHRMLMLPGETMKNLILIAKDVSGGKALGFAHRNWKDGSDAPVFCSDHTNDCSPHIFFSLREEFL
jgi:hypothetical protein